MSNASFLFRDGRVLGTENNDEREERDGFETSARKEEEASTLADTEKGKSMTLTNAPIVEEFDPVKVRED